MRLQNMMRFNFKKIGFVHFFLFGLWSGATLAQRSVEWRPNPNTSGFTDFTHKRIESAYLGLSENQDLARQRIIESRNWVREAESARKNSGTSTSYDFSSRYQLEEMRRSNPGRYVTLFLRALDYKKGYVDSLDHAMDDMKGWRNLEDLRGAADILNRAFLKEMNIAGYRAESGFAMSGIKDIIKAGPTLAKMGSAGALGAGIGLAATGVTVSPWLIAGAALGPTVIDGGKALFDGYQSYTVQGQFLHIRMKDGSEQKISVGQALLLADQNIDLVVDLLNQDSSFFLTGDYFGIRPDHLNTDVKFQLQLQSEVLTKLEGQNKISVETGREMRALISALMVCDLTTAEGKEKFAEILKSQGGVNVLSNLTREMGQVGVDRILDYSEVAYKIQTETIRLSMSDRDAMAAEIQAARGRNSKETRLAQKAASEKVAQHFKELDKKATEINEDLDFARSLTGFASAAMNMSPDLAKPAQAALALSRTFSDAQRIMPDLLKAFDAGWSKNASKMLISSFDTVSLVLNLVSVLSGLFGGSGPDPVMVMLERIEMKIDGMREEMRDNFKQTFEMLGDVLKGVQDIRRDLTEIRSLVNEIIHGQREQAEAIALLTNLILSDKREATIYCLESFPVELRRSIHLSKGQLSELVKANEFQSAMACLGNVERLLSSAAIDQARNSKLYSSLLSYKLGAWCDRGPEGQRVIDGVSGRTVCDNLRFNSGGVELQKIEEIIPKTTENVADSLVSPLRDFALQYAATADSVMTRLSYEICRNVYDLMKVEKKERISLHDFAEALDLPDLAQREVTTSNDDEAVLSCGKQPIAFLTPFEVSAISDFARNLSSIVETPENWAMARDNVQRLKQSISIQRQNLAMGIFAKGSFEYYRANLIRGFQMSGGRSYDVDSHLAELSLVSNIAPYLGDLRNIIDADALDPQFKEFRGITGLEKIFDVRAAQEYRTRLAKVSDAAEVLTDPRLSFPEQLNQGIQIVEGPETPVLLFQDLRNFLFAYRDAFEKYSASILLKMSLDSVRGSLAKVAGKIMATNRNLSPRFLFETIMPAVKDLSEESESKWFAEQNGRKDDEFGDDIKRSDKNFMDQEANRNILRFDLRRYGYGPTDEKWGVVHYHLEGVGSDQGRISFAVPDLPDEIQIETLSSTILSGPAPSARNRWPLTRRVLVFRESDLALQALLSAREDSQARGPRDSSSIVERIWWLRENLPRDFLTGVRATVRVEQEQVGRPGSKNFVDVQVPGPMLPQDIEGFILSLVYEPDSVLGVDLDPAEIAKNLKITTESVEKLLSKYRHSVSEIRKVQASLKDEVARALKRGDLLNSIFSEFQSYKKEFKKSKFQAQKKRPEFSKIYSMLSSGASMSLVSEDFKNENPDLVDLYMREDPAAELPYSVNDLHIVVVYGAKGFPALYNRGDYSTLASNQSDFQNISIPRLRYLGNQLLKNWTLETQKADEWIRKQLNSGLSQAWLGEPSVNPNKGVIELERELRNQFKRATESIEPKDSETKSVRNLPSKRGPLTIYDKLRISRDLSAERLKNTRDAFMEWFQASGILDPRETKTEAYSILRNQIEEDKTTIQNINWSGEDLSFFEAVKLSSDQKFPDLDFNSFDAVKMARLRDDIFSNYLSALDRLEQFVWTEVAPRGRLWRRHSRFLNDLDPISEWMMQVETSRILAKEKHQNPSQNRNTSLKAGLIQATSWIDPDGSLEGQRQESK